MARAAHVSGRASSLSDYSRYLFSPVERVVMARLAREERERPRPLRTRPIREFRPATDFGRALADALEGVVLD